MPVVVGVSACEWVCARAQSGHAAVEAAGGRCVSRFGSHDHDVVEPLVLAAVADADLFVTRQADAVVDHLRHFLDWVRPAP